MFNALCRKRTFLVLLVVSCWSPVALAEGYLDSVPPGEAPQLYAPERLQVCGEFLQAIDVSEDLSRHYLQVTDAGWGKGEIVELLVDAKGDLRKQYLVGVETTARRKRSGEPCVYDQGNKLFFASYGNIWSMRRNASGWSEPVKLGPSINKPGWKQGCPTVSQEGTLYFHSLVDSPYENAIYCSRFVDGSYAPRVRLDVLSEIGDAGDPGIAPDDSYIVFASSRDGGKGFTDLYVSFASKKGWSKPKHLGDSINSDAWELGPKISPDGKYLFFYRRDRFRPASFSRIYWVSTAAIFDLR